MPIWLSLLWALTAVVLIVVALWIRGRLNTLLTKEIEPTLREIRDAVKKIDRLAVDVHRTVAKIDDATSVVTTVSSLASATSKVIAGPKSTVQTFLTGLKEGLRVLRKMEDPKKVVHNE